MLNKDNYIQVEIINDILLAYRNEIGKDYKAYYNHVHRVYYLTLHFLPPHLSPKDTVAIAAAFHDIGLWTSETWDYLDPSIEIAATYLEKNGLQSIETEVAQMIFNHHKLTTYDGENKMLVNAFRKADTIEVLAGLKLFGLPKETYKQLREAFPLLGFHSTLTRLFLKHLPKNWKSPFPMYKS